MRNSDLRLLIELLLPGVQVPAGGGDVEEKHGGITLHQPLAHLHPPALLATNLQQR